MTGMEGADLRREMGLPHSQAHRPREQTPIYLHGSVALPKETAQKWLRCVEMEGVGYSGLLRRIIKLYIAEQELNRRL